MLRRKVQFLLVLVVALLAAVPAAVLPLVCQQQVLAAIAATTVFEVRSTGLDSQGGGFNSARGGTDYSQQDSAQATGTVTVSGTTCTATTGIFTSAMVGNLITDGTSWREITAFTSSTVVTLDATVSWTGASIKVGGALASIGKANALFASGNYVFVKYNATPYSISSASTGVSGGCWSGSLFGTGNRSGALCGYDTTRAIGNRDANRPTLKATVGTLTIFTQGNGNNFLLENIIFDGNSQASSSGASFSTNQLCSIRRCKFMNFTGTALTNSSGYSCYDCEFTGNSGISSAGGCYHCRFWSNTATCAGFNVGAGVCYCLFYDNSGASTDAINLGNSNTVGPVIGNTIHNTGRHGININGNVGASYGLIENNVITKSGGWGITVSNEQDQMVIRNNAFGSGAFTNTSGTVSVSGTQSASTVVGTTTLASGDPYTDSTNHNYTLTSTSTGRDTGFDSFEGLTDNGHLDPGGMQHQDSGGGSTGFSGRRGVGAQ